VCGDGRRFVVSVSGFVSMLWKAALPLALMFILFGIPELNWIATSYWADVRGI